MKTLVAVLLFIISLTANAGEVFIAGSYEFQHVKGATGVVGEYRFDNGVALHAAGYTSANHLAAGVLYRWRGWVIEPGLGVVYLDDLTRVNGTHANFVLAIDTKPIALFGLRWQAGWRHYSNGRGIFGWAEDVPNGGWNFLVVGALF